MVKLKGELLWVQQMATTWEDPVISVSRLVGHFILLDLYDISLIIKNVFLSRHGSHFISFSSKRYAHHIYVPKVFDGSPIQVDGWGFIYLAEHLNTRLFSGMTRGHHLYYE